MKTRSAARIAADERNSRRAVEKYHTDPAICMQCYKVIEISASVKPHVAKKKKFCSRSCAGTFNNTAFPKRSPQGQCDVCGKAVSTSRKYCDRNCGQKAKQERILLLINDPNSVPTLENKNGPRVRNMSVHVVACRQRIKVRAIAYKGGKCVRCSYDTCVRSLHFHHVDPSVKDFAISKYSRTWDKMRDELDKCVLLCSNCHGELHSGLWNLNEVLVDKFLAIQKMDEPMFAGPKIFQAFDTHFPISIV